MSLPGQLARPGLIPGGSPPGSRGCLVPLSRVGNHDQPGEVQLLSVSGGTVSRGGHRRKDFYGFSIARLRLQAAVNLRRISVLRSTSCQLVAVASGDAVLSVTSGSRGPPADEIAPDLPSPLLGSVGSFGSGTVVSGLSSGPSVVASRGSTLSWCVSPSGLPRSGLLVRRFRRRLGGSLGRQGCFRPLGPVGGSSSVNARELLAVRHGLLHFQSFLSGTTVAVFCDNVTAVAYLRKKGGTRSPALNTIAQEILRWAESLRIRLAPQFIPGIRNVLTDSLSRPHQLPSSEWSLNMDVFRSLTSQWPVMVDLFATSDNHRCSTYFSPYRDLLSAGTDALLQSWDGLLAYAFQPWSILPQVLAKLRVSHRTLLTLTAPYWPQRPWFVGLLQLSMAPPATLSAPRPPLPASVSSTLPRSPQAGPSCLETVQQFTRTAGFSSAVAAQASLACRPSSRSNYQLKWSVYRSWCRSQGHSISRPSLSKVADFLWWLRLVRGLSVSSIKGYRSMPSAVFRFHLPALSNHPVLRDLLLSFRSLLHPTRCVILPGTSRRFALLEFWRF